MGVTGAALVASSPVVSIAFLSEQPVVECAGQESRSFASFRMTVVARTSQSWIANYLADLKIAKTAPCGSAMTDMRPTPSTVIGGTKNFAPISLALLAVASTSST